LLRRTLRRSPFAHDDFRSHVASFNRLFAYVILWFVMKSVPVAILLFASVLVIGGCGKGSRPSAADEKPQLHKAEPPHGGTAVGVGDDYSLELLRDADTGTLSCYVMDDDMEEFIRSTSPSVTLVAKVRGEERQLVLSPIANLATGESVGNTSLFQGQADWLKTTSDFDVTIQGIAIRGNTFTDIKFNFPKGSE
jgi:hypothetical protein